MIAKKSFYCRGNTYLKTLVYFYRRGIKEGIV